MPISVAILKQLAASNNSAVERTIEATLPHATAEEQGQLAEVLLSRSRRGGWVALIRTFDRLDGALQDRLVKRPREIYGPLSEAMQDSTGPGRSNVIRIVRRCADNRMIYLLAQALMDGRGDVREQAGEALLESVRRYRRGLVEGEAPETARVLEDTVQLRRALEFGLRQFRTHRQPAAVMATLICERQHETQTWAYFHDNNEGLTRAATAILRQLTEPALAGATLLALGSALKPAAMAGLSGAVNPAICAALAGESYRLVDPVLREGAMAIGHVRMLASPDGPAPWTKATWPAWLRLIENVGIPAVLRQAWLVRMLEDAERALDAGWTLSAMRPLAELGLGESGAVLARLAADPDVRVARSAARHLLTRRHPEWRIHAGALLSSPHAAVRTLVSMSKAGGAAGGGGESETFGGLWHDYRKLPPAVQFTAARTVSTTTEQFPEQLRLKLSSEVVAEVAQGLRMLSSLTSLVEYRGQIIVLCGHKDSRIAAIAVKLIGRLADPRLRDLLEAAAHHEDARVRANAVESMETLDIADRSQQVITMLNSRHSRERANAIKAMSQFNFATARECLARMLTDPNPMHRVSALWVVEQLQFLEIIRQVHFVARRDPNVRIRRRAGELLANITNSVSAASVEGAR
jgi:hypothetical protein